MTTPVTSFATLGVPSELVKALERTGISEPFEVQVATIPDALAGRDVLARAPTGSGKTLAFGLPLLARLEPGRSRRPRGLILSPTRELAEQIRRELQPLAKAADRTVLAVYGGVGIGPQASSLRRGVDLLVACPGRLRDLIEQGLVELDDVEQVVVDEADRMADMGFLPEVRALLDLTAADRQTVLFSATLDRDVQVLIDEYQDDPVRHEVGEVEPDLSLVTHRFVSTSKDMKIGVTADIVDETGPTMVFCRTRHGVDRVARQLKRAGVKSGWIHGGRTQSQRTAALSAFTDGRVAALVATDVAARGIHVDNVACVVHYDPPADSKDYVHRSGRTARAGAGGVVVSLVNSDQVKAVAKLRKQVGLPGSDLEPTPEVSVREVPAWVDERPNSKRRHNKQGPRRSARRPANTAARKPDDNAAGDRDQATGSPPDVDPRPKRSSRRGKRRPPESAGPGPKRGRSKRKKNAKRSGRPRAKNHKQTRGG